MENANNTLKEVESHIQNGFYNTAVNRMYYAYYYAASAILIAKGVETESHDGVRRMVGQELVLKGFLDAEYGRFYSQLFSKRETGDYEDFINHDFMLNPNDRFRLKRGENGGRIAPVCIVNGYVCGG